MRGQNLAPFYNSLRSRFVRPRRAWLGRTLPLKKYVVLLSVEEREQLRTLIRKGKSPARRLLKARILLKADVSEAGEGWSDSRIIELVPFL